MRSSNLLFYCYHVVFLCTFLLVSCNSNVENNVTPKHVAQSQKQVIPKLPNTKASFYNGMIDSNDHLWFATRGNGIYSFDGKKFKNYTIKEGISSNHVNCIFEDAKGMLWIGTDKGVDLFNENTVFQHLNVPFTDTTSVWLDTVYPVVNPNEVLSILEDDNGAIWLGTNGAGVYQYDGQKFTQHLSKVGMVYDDNLYHNIVLSIDKDDSGNLWFSSLSHGGVSKFDGEKFTHYISHLSDDFVRVVYVDSKNTVWVGTHGNHKGGLDRMDASGITTFYKTTDGFRHNNVSNILEDSKGHLWIASGTTPLSKLRDGHFEIFTVEGQTFSNIRFLVEDANGNIWFGGRNGLWKYEDDQVIYMIQE